MYHLIKKAVSVRKHLDRNRGDKDSKLCVSHSTSCSAAQLADARAGNPPPSTAASF